MLLAMRVPDDKQASPLAWLFEITYMYCTAKSRTFVTHRFAISLLSRDIVLFAFRNLLVSSSEPNLDYLHYLLSRRAHPGSFSLTKRSKPPRLILLHSVSSN